MRIVVELSGYYSWEPLEKGIEPSEDDIRTRRVKLDSAGNWLMCVPRKGSTHTEVFVCETDIIELSLQDAMRDRLGVTRTEAVGHLLARMVMPENANPKSIVGFTAENDDGPNEALFLKRFGEFVEGGLLHEEFKADLLDKYLTTTDLVPHLLTKFSVKKNKANAPKPEGT